MMRISITKNRSLSWRLAWATIMVSGGLASVLSFQNCTNPATGLNSDGVTDQAAQDLPFAYDTVADQISFMSCSQFASGTFDTSAYFSFRVGAYRTGGIGINSTFMGTSQVANSNFTRQTSLLEDSPANTNTVLQLAVRPINDYQSIMTTIAGSPVANEDYTNMFTTLGVDGVTESLLALGAGGHSLYYNDGTTVTGSRVEGDLSFASSTSVLDSITQATANTAYIALTYTYNNPNSTTTTDSTLAFAPSLAPSAMATATPTAADTNRSVYGRGFGLTYGQPSVSGLYASFPASVITSVTEYSLVNTADRSTVGTWTCPTDMQFRIVRREDLSAAGANCNLVPDPPTLSSDLQMVRNQLRFEDWYVDMANHCIIPKKTTVGCYGTSTAVVYTNGTQCDRNNLAAQCVAYASVCYRN